MRRNQMDEQEKELEEILRTFDKASSPQRIVFKIKHSKTISSLGKFPKNQLTPNGLPAHQIKPNTKDKLSQAKAGISPLHAKPQ